MSKKRKFHAEYNLSVNGNEFPREYTITGVRSRDEAEAKLKRMCSKDSGTELIIKSITEV